MKKIKTSTKVTLLMTATLGLLSNWAYSAVVSHSAASIDEKIAQHARFCQVEKWDLDETRYSDSGTIIYDVTADKLSNAALHTLLQAKYNELSGEIRIIFRAKTTMNVANLKSIQLIVADLNHIAGEIYTGTADLCDVLYLSGLDFVQSIDISEKVIGYN